MKSFRSFLPSLLIICISFSSATSGFAQDTDSTKTVTNTDSTLKASPEKPIVVAEVLRDSLKEDALTPVAPKKVGWKAIAIPSAMVAYGVTTFASDWLKDVNIFGRKTLGSTDQANRRTKIDDYTLFVPAEAILVLNLVGVKGKHNLLDATLLYAMSSGISTGIVFPIKSLSKSLRPDGSESNSFPSGHTSQAFLAAECLRQEYLDVSPWIGAAGYGVATLTGFLRMLNNRHWFSDVIAGAGIGILSTRLSYYVYPKLKNLIIGKHKDSESKTGNILFPSYNNGMVGLNFIATF